MYNHCSRCADSLLNLSLQRSGPPSEKMDGNSFIPRTGKERMNIENLISVAADLAGVIRWVS
jgi:hypothetical protein